MSYHNPNTAPPPPEYEDLALESKNYWCLRRGQEEPPPPTIRNGQLGRYLDPYGAEMLMNEAKQGWQKTYPWLLLAFGGPALFIGVDWIFIFLALPFYATWYLLARRPFQKRYDHFFNILTQCVQTDEPVWDAYDQHRLQTIERRPECVFP